MQVMEHPNGPFKMPTWRCGPTARQSGSSSPLLGQHGAEVLNTWLGVGAEEVDA